MSEGHLSNLNSIILIAQFCSILTPIFRIQYSLPITIPISQNQRRQYQIILMRPRKKQLLIKLEIISWKYIVLLDALLNKLLKT